MTGNTTLSDFQNVGERNPMVAAYRHDAHKLNGEPHRTAPDTFAGVPVNQSIPHGADADASALSRPSGKPEKTVDNHDTHYRLSLLTGESAYDPDDFSRPILSEAISDLLTSSDPEMIHRTWLTSDVASGFNESVYYPYTSLKYHTLLVGALLDAYQQDQEFEDLLLIVDDSDEVEPFRTIYAGEQFSLRLGSESGGRPWARLGSRPWRSWAATWMRLTANPLKIDQNKQTMVLDANLRRIGAWSTALQYIEDFEEEHGL